MKGVILVTGGCGFIGSAFIRHVLDNTDYEIFNIDKLTYAARPEALNGYASNPRLMFSKTDICDIAQVADVAKDIEYIVHFAAETHVDRSIGAWESGDSQDERWQQDDVFIRTNILGTQRLLDFARTLSGLKKFVYISTDEVYGPTSGASSEDDPFNPRNPYAATKVGGEALTNAYFHTFGVPTCITRSCNNYGPWQGSEKFIPVAILSALADKPIPIYGSGENIRDWIYVEDNIKAILAVMDKGVLGNAYNIAAGEFKTNLQVVATILEALGRPESLMRLVKDRPGHDFQYSMQGWKLLKECEWWAETSFDEGIEKTIGFYKKHEDYFREDQKRSGVEDRIKSLLGDVK